MPSSHPKWGESEYVHGAAEHGPRLLVTGFGPFPNAPDNPTEALVKALAGEPPETFSAAALRAVVLPTEYRRSWQKLRRITARFGPDVVVHFGLSRNSDRMRIERSARRYCSSDLADASGYAPRSGPGRRSDPDLLQSTLPVDAIVEQLEDSGFPANASDNAGPYVCNATLYRSLLAAPEGLERSIGFVHVPAIGVNGFTSERLKQAAFVILRAAVGSVTLFDAREQAGEPASGTSRS